MPEPRLKNYQQLALDALRDYFKACVRLDSAGEAFAEVVRDEDATLAAAPATGSRPRTNSKKPSSPNPPTCSTP